MVERTIEREERRKRQGAWKPRGGVREAGLAATLRLHLLQGARASEDQHLHPILFIYLFSLRVNSCRPPAFCIKSIRTHPS